MFDEIFCCDSVGFKKSAKLFPMSVLHCAFGFLKLFLELILSITKEIRSESEPGTELKVLDYILSKLITGSSGPSDSRSFLSVHSGLVF